MLLTPTEMQATEQRAFAAGISAEALMDQAGLGIAEVVQQFFPTTGTCLAVFGKGHNGADALVAAHHLLAAGWRILLASAFAPDQWAELTRKKFQALQSCPQLALDSDWLSAVRSQRSHAGPLVILDGLLGIGSQGPLREPLAKLTKQINHLRQDAFAQVVAIDLPTGLDGDTGLPAEDCIIADLTVTLAYAKRGLLQDSAVNHVGRLAVVLLPALAPFVREDAPSLQTVATAEALAELLPRRSFDSHKGQFGRVHIVAGSRGFTGAALMCSAACLRAGAGLVSLFVPEDAYPIVAAAATPEVMVHPVRSYAEVLKTRCDVLALGPGLGRMRDEEVKDLLRHCAHPMVIDADGLNILATDLSLLATPVGPRLLTPHPGEMARLNPAAMDQSRLITATRFTGQHPVTLLLKGSRTIIAEKGHPAHYNTTGSPGMATGGMGDVLTGVCAALAGARLPLYDAARVGAWICGRAAELALSSRHDSEESLTPTSLLQHLGRAFRSLHAREY